MDVATLILSVALAGQTGTRSGQPNANRRPAPSAPLSERGDRSGGGLNLNSPRRDQADASSDDQATADDSTSTGRLTDVPDSLTRPDAPAVLSAAMAGDKGWFDVNDPDARGSIRMLSLVEVFSRIRERAKQVEAVEAYWRLSSAVLDYQFARRHRDQFGELNQDDAQLSSQVRSARSANRAAVTDALISATAAQHDLAKLMRLGPRDKLPVPQDLPRVGDYNTGEEQLFSERRPPSPEQRLLLAALPVRRKAIDDYARSIVAAEDAVQAVADEYQQGKGDIHGLMASLDHLSRQRKAFSTAVRRYNIDIAGYALSVAPASATPQQLSDMLVKSRPRSGEATLRGDRPRDAGPTLGSPRTTFADPARDAAPREADSRPRVSGPFAPRRTSNYRAADADAPLYESLEELDDKLRSQRLGEQIYRLQLVPQGTGKGVRLETILKRVAAADRYTVIDDYWTAAEKLALYQTLWQTKDQLDVLTPAAARFGNQPGGSVAMVRLNAAKLATAAAIKDLEVSVLETTFDVTRDARGSLAEAWLATAIGPHTARYRTVVESLPEKVVAAQGLHHLAAGLPEYAQRLRQLAAAVVLSDRARVEAMARLNTKAAAVEQSLSAIQTQADQTRQFIRTATRYNRAIAAYALAVAPAAISADQLLARLVIVRPAR